VLQKPTEEVEAVLRSLAADDVAMLESTRQTARRRHPAYRFREHVLRKLGTAVTYHRCTGDELDRKIVATVNELGQITNGVVQALFDVKVERASRILGDMVAVDPRQDLRSRAGTARHLWTWPELPEPQVTPAATQRRR